MKTKNFKMLKKISGENGVYVRPGENTFSFEGTVEEPNGEMAQYTFTVEGVETQFDAIRLVDSYYCGYYIPHSAKNIRKITQ